MHPLSLLIFWLVLGRNFQMADVDAALDTNKISKPLATAGAALIALGLILVARDLAELGRVRAGGEARRRGAGGDGRRGCGARRADAAVRGVEDDTDGYCDALTRRRHRPTKVVTLFAGRVAEKDDWFSVIVGSVCSPSVSLVRVGSTRARHEPLPSSNETFSCCEPMFVATTTLLRADEKCGDLHVGLGRRRADAHCAGSHELRVLSHHVVLPVEVEAGVRTVVRADANELRLVPVAEVAPHVVDRRRAVVGDQLLHDGRPLEPVVTGRELRHPDRDAVLLGELLHLRSRRRGCTGGTPPRRRTGVPADRRG